ncbi:hypothetical protein [Persicobacter diffluens]|uniref:Uncharacterized protein n=1 Tax=Persicobacter diffluens TaxID=981 RepID=A0AAN4W2I5_9BACT|nr:hypothetical protein PEDI_51110 [Persicobacter diffluens]
MKRIWFVQFILVLASCQEPIDPVITSVQNTKQLLQSHIWTLEDFDIRTTNEEIPAPILFGATENHALWPGLSSDESQDDPMSVIFTPDRKVIASQGPHDALGDSVSSYFVINDHLIRLSSQAVSINYEYLYSAQEKEFQFYTDADGVMKLVHETNQKFISAVTEQTPQKVGDIIAALVYNNETIQQLINKLVVQALAGELSFLNEFDPEQVAQELAGKIIQLLQQIDWEQELTDILKPEFEKLNQIDPEEATQVVAQALAQYLQQALSEENLYEGILPLVLELKQHPEEGAATIAKLVNEIFLDFFDQEHISPIISEAWLKFSALDPQQVNQLAVELTRLLEAAFINEAELTQLCLPFIQKIEDTSLFEMGELAAATTDALRGLIDQLNQQFPDLNLDPDYETMEGIIKAAFITAKPIIGLSGVETVAQEVAQLILTQVLTTDFLQQSIMAALESLQKLDPQNVGATLGQWIAQLALEVSPALLSEVQQVVSPILAQLDAEGIASVIAASLSELVSEHLSPAQLEPLVFPLLEAISNVNAEALARLFAQSILELDAIKDLITEEKLVAILLPVLESVAAINPEELAQSIIDAVVATGIFDSVLTEERASALIAILWYNSLWEQVTVANNFESVTIKLAHP